MHWINLDSKNENCVEYQLSLDEYLPKINLNTTNNGLLKKDKCESISKFKDYQLLLIENNNLENLIGSKKADCDIKEYNLSDNKLVYLKRMNLLIKKIKVI
jgi:hypothetical protein